MKYEFLGLCEVLIHLFFFLVSRWKFEQVGAVHSGAFISALAARSARTRERRKKREKVERREVFARCEVTKILLAPLFQPKSNEQKINNLALHTLKPLFPFSVIFSNRGSRQLRKKYIRISSRRIQKIQSSRLFFLKRVIIFWANQNNHKLNIANESIMQVQKINFGIQKNKN